MGALSTLKSWSGCIALVVGLVCVAVPGAADAKPKARAVLQTKPSPRRAQKPSAAATARAPGNKAPATVPAAAKAPSTKAASAAPAAAKAPIAKIPENKPEAHAICHSVGSPNDGHLVGGLKLDTSQPHLRVVPAYARGDTRWGHPSLIHALDRAAKKVSAKYPGAVLGVGDISRRGGGDIFLHRSHESGRDADVAFYVNDQRGKSLLPDTFVKFESTPASTSMPGAKFDVAKNWLFVESLLLDPEARVSHIFVAAPLRRMLLAYARPRVRASLYNRAAQVMMQPKNALPHDNHFHVRISCPKSSQQQCVELPKMAKKMPKAGNAKVAKKPANAKPNSASQAIAAKPKPAPRVAAAAPKPAPATKPAPKKVAAADTKPGPKPILLEGVVSNDDPLDRLIFSVPAVSIGDADHDADRAEVENAVDESGTVRITR